MQENGGVRSEGAVDGPGAFRCRLIQVSGESEAEDAESGVSEAANGLITCRQLKWIKGTKPSLLG